MDDALLFRCVTDQATPAEAAAVAVWRRASAEHEQRYRDLEAILTAAMAAEAARRPGDPPSAREIVRRAGASVTGGVVALPRVATRRSWTRPMLAAAALLLVSFSLVGGLRLFRGAYTTHGVDQVVTGVSETATVELHDGTVVRLAPKSRLQVVPGAERSVSLEGRAYFAVAKKGGKLFRIQTAAGEVTVTGTRFDLEAQSRNLRLIVVEGSVILSSRHKRTTVTAGEMARVVGDSPAPVVRVPEAGALVDWVGNFMAFQATPLTEVAREIERRFGVRVALADSALGNHTVTAWFADGSLDEVVDVVCVVTSARCSIDGRVVTIRPREQNER
jgi:ferric-dicitrate binding protein FerR (iron transport regulator)